LKYSPPATPITVSARATGQTVTISVADQGAGIPESEQSRIFEKFYRTPKHRRQLTGTGMGLTIAREILRSHGGDVSVKSAPGRGAEFQLSLPVISEGQTV
jgi:signal transduction histidine kinase